MASGSQRRVTTVHDRAALRVHPNGTRVTARESRYATEDLRGNRIAVNAGGTGNVKKRRRAAASDVGSEPLEEFDIETDEYQPSEKSSSTDSWAGTVEGESEEGGGKRKRRKKDTRRMKQSQFYRNFDFVLGGTDETGTVPAFDDPLLPSSVGWVFIPIRFPTNSMGQDLLKCLHRFAAEYYSNKGQLIDATRIVRQKKRDKMNSGTGNRPSPRSTVGSTSGEESDNSGVGIAPTPSAMLQTPRQKEQQEVGLVKDMYKMFDGSALVALGRNPLVNSLLAAECDAQEFSCTSTSSDLFDETGVLKGIPSGSWGWRAAMKIMRMTSMRVGHYLIYSS